MKSKAIKSTTEDHSLVLSVFLNKDVSVVEHINAGTNEPLITYSLSASYVEQPKTLNDLTLNAWLAVFGNKRFESVGTIFSTLIDAQLEQRDILTAKQVGEGASLFH